MNNKIDVDRDIVTGKWNAVAVLGTNLALVGQGDTLKDALADFHKHASNLVKAINEAGWVSGDDTMVKDQPTATTIPSPMGDRIVTPEIADLIWFGKGGWVITVAMINTDRWEVSGKHPKQNMGGVFGTTLSEAIANARAWVEKWEGEENQRLAERKLERT